MGMMHTPRPDASLPDQALAGRYRLDDPLGEGGMAQVVRGHDLTLDVPRALKILIPELARKRSLRERFEAEARIMARLEHPHIVRVFDVGVHDKVPFIAMELLPGGSLHTWLEAHGAMPVRQAVQVTLDLCAAVEHAHSHGVIHRDIKPHNVLVAANGAVKLTDFGIARTDLGHTKTGAAMGTLGYVAPEQLANAKGATPAADVYSLAVTLWKLVTDGPVERLAYDLNHGALDQVPVPLRGVLEPALAQRVEQRTPDIPTFRAGLERALRALPEGKCLPLVHGVPVSGEDCPSWDTLSSTLHGFADERSQAGPPATPASMSPRPVPARRATPVPRPPERKGPYVVRLTDEDLQATLDAREARRRRGDEKSESDEGMEDRIGSDGPLDEEGWLSMLRRVFGGTVRWIGFGLVLMLLPLAVIGGLNFADRAFDLRGHRAAMVESARSMVDLVVLEGPAAVQDRQDERDARAQELLERYHALQDAEGAERVEAAQAFVESAERSVASTLPADPALWTPQQRAEVDRLLRMRQAVDAYQQAKERVEGPEEGVEAPEEGEAVE